MRVLMMLLMISVISPAFSNESPQALQEAFNAAVQANDADAVAVLYTVDATSYAIDVMVENGREAVRKNWQNFFSAYKVKFISLPDSNLEIMGDMAVAWGLFTLIAETIDGGEPVEMRGRYTDVSKKIDGKWLYVFDHASMPIN